MRRRSQLGLASLVAAMACGPSRSLPSTPGVRLVVDTTYYDAEGVTRREWLASMPRGARRAGVRSPYHAHTEWQTRWSFASARLTARGCAPQLPVVEVTIRYTMPRLDSDSGVAREDLLEWRRYHLSLWRHEEGHAARAVRAAAEMRDSLWKLHAPSCSALQPSATRAIAAVMAKYRGLQADYDARTGHGARQGATLLPDGIARVPADTTYRDTLP